MTVGKMNKKSYCYIFSSSWNPRHHVWKCFKFTDICEEHKESFAWLVSIRGMQRKIKINITSILSLSTWKSGGIKWIELEGVFCSPWHQIRQSEEKDKFFIWNTEQMLAEYEPSCTIFLFFQYWRATNKVRMKFTWF